MTRHDILMPSPFNPLWKFFRSSLSPCCLKTFSMLFHDNVPWCRSFSNFSLEITFSFVQFYFCYWLIIFSLWDSFYLIVGPLRFIFQWLLFFFLFLFFSWRSSQVYLLTFLFFSYEIFNFQTPCSPTLSLSSPWPSFAPFLLSASFLCVCFGLWLSTWWVFFRHLVIGSGGSTGAAS